MKHLCIFLCLEFPTYCELKPHADSEKAWVWCAVDCSYGGHDVR